MPHVLVRRLDADENGNFGLMIDWLKQTLGFQRFDPDVLDYRGTFTLAAGISGDIVAFLPVQRPLMMESVAFKPGISEELKALAMTRLAEHAIESCIGKKAGEVYFLCQEPDTKKFAERHHFSQVLGMDLMRFKAKEWERGL